MAREYSLEKTRNFGIIVHIDAGPSYALTAKGTTSSTCSASFGVLRFGCGGNNG